MTLQIVAFAGSLRRASYTRALLRNAQELSPVGLRIEVIDISGIPFYNADVEAAGLPSSVAVFAREIRMADGVLIATPEHNDGIPGVLTTAIDWASRPPGRASLTGKPVAVMGATPAIGGTARGQLHLRTLLHHIGARVLPPPELLIAHAASKFDAGLHLHDDAARRVLADLLERFARWIARERVAADFERHSAHDDAVAAVLT